MEEAKFGDDPSNVTVTTYLKHNQLYNAKKKLSHPSPSPDFLTTL